MNIDFTPSKTCTEFMNSDAKMRVLMGPVGSGKSVASCFEIVRRASQQHPSQDGVRRSRAAVVRETVRQLTDTTIKTFLDWFPPGVCGNFMRTTKTYFFKDGVQMVVDGYSLEEVTDILETRIEYREKREKVQTDMLKAMGDLSPAWGMVGTLIGLVLMLAGFGGEGGADNLGGGMAAALITTLYGAVFANLFFLPMADKMGNKTTQTSMSAALLVEAARLIHQKKHPLIVREKLNSFIPPGEWITEAVSYTHLRAHET